MRYAKKTMNLGLHIMRSIILYLYKMEHPFR